MTVVGSHWQAPIDPNVDAAVIQLDESVPATVAEPLRVSELSVDRLPGARLLLGGYGITDDDKTGWRRFVTEEVTNARAGMITVDGRGKSGACIADSGGPALWREGAPTVVGILKQGDGTCRGLDHYVSVASLRDWIAETVQLEQAQTGTCGAITADGACFASDSLQQTVWCQDGMLQSMQCRGTEVCGWDVTTAGFRCLLRENDACQGVSQLGACRAGRAVYCDAGIVREQSCGACETCDTQPSTGAVACLAGTL